MSLEAALAAFSALPLDLSQGSRIDLATNVLLTVPLAFFWTGALWPVRHAALRIPVVLVVFFGCLAMSVAVEFCQLFFPGRSTSLNDVAAQALGEVIGIALWWVVGRPSVHWFESLPFVRGHSDMARRGLVAYLIVLIGYSLLPLDLGLSPIELYHKWREGRIVIVPFGFNYADRAQHVYDVLSDVVIWMPVGFLWRWASTRTSMSIWTCVVGLAMLMELLQLFVFSRVTDSTDIILAGVGAYLGIRAARRVRPGQPHSRVATANRPAKRSPPMGALPWVMGLAAWLAILAIVFWYPFNFNFDVPFLRQRLQELRQVPLEAYWVGSPFRAVTEVLHKTGFMFPLGVILAMLGRKLYKWVPPALVHLLAMAFIVGVALGIEMAQIALPGKNADPTDGVLEIFGGAAGYIMTICVHRRLQRAQGTDKHILIERERRV